MEGNVEVYEESDNVCVPGNSGREVHGQDYSKGYLWAEWNKPEYFLLLF